MNRRSFLSATCFFLCFSLFSQEQSSDFALNSMSPSGRLRNIAASLQELEASETASQEDLMRLKEELERLEASLESSEAMLAELQTQTDGALERYGKLLTRYTEQQKSLSRWRLGCLGSSGLSILLLVLMALL